MSKFNVIVTRDCTESTTVDVIAADRQEASAKAQAEARAHPSRFDWVHDDGSGGFDVPYVAGGDAVTEVSDAPL